MSKTKIPPSTVLCDRLRAAGCPSTLMWRIDGPLSGGIAWTSCYMVEGRSVIVLTFRDGNGWDAYTNCDSNNIDATVADVLARCKVTNWAEGATYVPTDDYLAPAAPV